MLSEIREILSSHGRLGSAAGHLGVDDDLYLAGMTSHAGVNVMLALEERFAIEFPDEMLTRSVFSTISNIEMALLELKDENDS